ncbi:fused MFS/spermidine synthase [soil metagenome]
METADKSPSHSENDKHLAFVFLSFFISGFAALIYELCWQRLLLRILGSTLPAVTLVLCVFMTGLATGCFLSGKFVKRVGNPLLAYGSLELVIGLFGLLSLWLFDNQPASLVSFYDSATTQLLGLSNVDSFEPFNSLFWCRAFYASVLLLVPTAAMGATFPLVSKFLEQTTRDKNNQGTAYLVNLVGASLGTICAGFFLMPNFGLTISVVTASILSGLVFGLLFMQCRSLRQIEQKEQSQLLGDSWRTLAPVAFAVLVNGAVGISLEVVWSRLFSLLVGSSTYSVASVFAVSIIGLALGTFIFQRVGDRVRSHKLWLAVLFCLIAICLYLDLWLIQLMPWLFNLNHELLSKSNSFVGYLLERIFVISLVVLPGSIFCGGVFPIALQSMAEQGVRKNILGLLYTCSSIGSVIGAACAGFLFVPLLGRMFTSGMESTICLIIGIEICFASSLIAVSSSRRLLIVAPLVLLALLFYRPAWNKALISSGIPFLSLPTRAATTKEIFDRVLSDSAHNKLLFYREGLNTTVTVSANIPQNIVYLKNDGKVEAALPFDLDRTADSSDLTTHFMLGKLPVSMNSAAQKNVFVVGLGSGATCGGALDESSVKKLKIAEIEPTIFEIQHYFEPANGAPLRPQWLASGRVVPFCGDARMSLNFSNEKYDVIISQPAEPWISGSSDLYTTEFWRIARARLNQHGCFCQWIQLYAIDPEFLAVLLRTFQNVFPNTYVYHYPHAGEIILLGTMQPLDAGQKNSNQNLIATPDALQKSCSVLGQKFNDFRLNSDDNLLTEYALPPRLYLSESLIEENLKAISSVK